MKNYVHKIIEIFTASEHSEEVTREVHQWLTDEEHAQEKEAALNTLWKETEGKVDASVWNSLAEVYGKLEAAPREAKPRYSLRIRRYAAAVAILAVAVSGTFHFTKDMYSPVAMIENYTPTGDMNTIKLPDGSEVQTNSGTVLLYPKTFKGDTRTVYLVGEANFKVKKNPDQPFIVKSTAMSVTALGTEFNVAAYPESDQTVATLIDGKIKVDCNNGQKSYILHPGQQLAYHCATSESQLTEVDLEDAVAWQKGMFVFRGATMKEILATLERRYAITFQYKADLFNEDKFNFRFREHSTIEEIMEVMQEVVGGFTYEVNGKVCNVKSIMKK